MAIKCCNGCVAPKRYPGCHGRCPEYLEEKAEYDRQQYEKGYADAMASIVRCEDCKHWEKCDSSLIGEVMCCTGQGAMLIQKNAYDFCSSGERRNNK